MTATPRGSERRKRIVYAMLNAKFARRDMARDDVLRIVRAADRGNLSAYLDAATETQAAELERILL